MHQPSRSADWFHATARSRITRAGLTFSVALSILGSAQALRAQETIPNSNALKFHIDGNARDIVMMPRSSHVCFLTGLGGRLDEVAAVEVHTSNTDMIDAHAAILRNGGFGGTVLDDDGEIWKLGAWKEKEESVFGEATCVPLSNFQMDPGGFIEVSRNVTASVTDCKQRRAENNLTVSEAAPFLTGVRGGFYGFSESVFVQQGESAADPAKVVATLDDCNVGFFQGHARSIYAGLPGSGRFPNYSARMTKAVTAISPDRGEAHLAPVEGSICFLTHVAGALVGSADEAKIHVMTLSGKLWWVLHVAASNSGKVEAKASCLYYDQRTPNVVGPQAPPQNGPTTGPGNPPQRPPVTGPSDTCRTTATGSIVRRGCPR